MDVPADVFSVEIPDMYYRGLITKRDYAHKDSFEVKFLEDGSRYWLPIADCQHWLKQMEARGRNETSETVGAASDTFAASILAGFAGKHSRPVRQALDKAQDFGSSQLGCRAGLLDWHHLDGIHLASNHAACGSLVARTCLCSKLACLYCT